MSVQTDEVQHSIEMHLPYTDKAMESHKESLLDGQIHLCHSYDLIPATTMMIKREPQDNHLWLPYIL